MSDDADAVELRCPECSTTWHASGEGDDATCPECETVVTMDEHGP